MSVSNRRRNRVLREIIAIREDSPLRIIRPDHPRLLALKEPALDLALRKLAAMKLISLDYADGKVYQILLSNEGFVYFERRSDELWRFVRRSVLIPFGVSLLTTLFTLAIQNNWFAVVLEWLLKHLAA